MPLGVPEQDIAASALPQKCLRTALGSGESSSRSDGPGEGGPLPTPARCTLNRRTAGSRAESSSPVTAKGVLAGSVASAPGPPPQPSQTKVTAAASPRTPPARSARSQRTGGSAVLRREDLDGSGRTIPGGRPAYHQCGPQGRSQPAPSGWLLRGWTRGARPEMCSKHVCEILP